MLDHLEAMNGKKSHQNHFFLQNLASPLTLLSKHDFAPNEHSKTTFGLIPPIKCKAMFGLHTISISHFSSFWS